MNAVAPTLAVYSDDVAISQRSHAWGAVGVFVSVSWFVVMCLGYMAQDEPKDSVFIWLLLLSVSFLIPLLIRVDQRHASKMKDCAGPLFTLAAQGIIHNLKNESELIAWSRIRRISWESSGGGNKLLIVPKDQTLLRSFLTFLGYADFRYYSPFLQVSELRIHEFLTTHAPPDLYKSKKYE